MPSIDFEVTVFTVEETEYASVSPKERVTFEESMMISHQGFLKRMLQEGFTPLPATQEVPRPLIERLERYVQYKEGEARVVLMQDSPTLGYTVIHIFASKKRAQTVNYQTVCDRPLALLDTSDGIDYVLVCK